MLYNDMYLVKPHANEVRPSWSTCCTDKPGPKDPNRSWRRAGSLLRISEITHWQRKKKPIKGMSIVVLFHHIHASKFSTFVLFRDYWVMGFCTPPYCCWGIKSCSVTGLPRQVNTLPNLCLYCGLYRRRTCTHYLHIQNNHNIITWNARPYAPDFISNRLDSQTILIQLHNDNVCLK